MDDKPSIGDPIPRGIVNRDTAVLGAESGHDENSENTPRLSLSEQISALQAEVDRLKDSLATAGRRTAESVREHPLMTATLLFSIATLAWIAVRNHRSESRFLHAYPALLERIDSWR